MQMKNGRMGVLCAAFLAMVACGVAGGCSSQHGKYTQEFKDQAQLKMAQLKAATSWDMANQQYQAGDLKKALKNVEDSIKLDDTVAKSHVLHGRILIEMDRLETALQAFDKAIEVDEKNAEAQYYEGIIYERFAQFETALDHYNKAADLDTTNPQYRLAAAEMLMQLNRIDEAEKTLNDRMPSFEHNAGFKQTLGHIAMIRKQPEKAARLFGEACILAPADDGLMEDLAHAQMESDQYADAEYTLRRLLDMDGNKNRRDLKYLRARCLAETDRPVEARSILLDLTRDSHGSQDVGVWVELGQVSLILKEDFRLRQCAQRVISLAPNRSEGYMMLATSQVRAGKPEEAIQTLSKAMSVSDDHASLAVMEGALYHEMGRESEARAAAQLALRADPTDARAHELLARVGRAGAAVADVPTDSTE